jgi:serine/threonine protein kinase/Flp pilus assembly protein TadD
VKGLFDPRGIPTTMKSAVNPGEMISHYRILKILGQGGMGIVYQAEDTRLNRTVALKFIHPTFARGRDETTRFVREAQAAAALNHPHITTVYEIGEEDGLPFIAMEYLDGQTLRDRLRAGSLSFEEAISIAGQVAAGLQHAHEKGVVHRDIKSANIFVCRDGQAKIMDFGLARLPRSAPLTRPAALLGTVDYMSPEQASGRDADGRTDIWSLGVVLYEMFTARLPFRGDQDQVVIQAILNQAPDPITAVRSDLPKGIGRIVGRCLEKDPADRYQRADDLKRDLGRLVNGPDRKTLTLDPGDGGPPGRPSGPVGRRIRRAIALSAAVFLLAGAFLFFTPLRNALSTLLHPSSLPDKMNLAVLPFDIVGGGSEDQAFADGLVAILTNKLTQVERFQGALEIVPASEVRQLPHPSAGNARQAFHANMVIEGHMVFMDQDIVVALNLNDAVKLRQLKSRDVRVPKVNRAALLTAVTNAVVEILALEVRPQAKRIWEAHEACRPESATLYIMAQGYLQRYDQEANIDIALGLLAKAVELDPSCAVAFAGLGQGCWLKYSKTQKPEWIDKAENAALKALALNKDLAEVRLILGIIHRIKGKYEDSLREIEAASRMDPGDFEVVRELGVTYEYMNRLADAEESYKKAVALRPDSWSGYNYLGVFYFQHGRYDEAEKAFGRIIELTPDNTWGYDLLGILFLQTGNIDKGIPMFEKSLRIRPTAGACSNLGTAFFFKSLYADAARLYEQAIDLGSNDEAIWGNLGDSYRYVPGAGEKARNAYQKACALSEQKLKINPNDGNLHKRLARFQALIGNRAAALAEIDKALKLMPGNAAVWETGIEVYERAGQRNRALQAARKLFEMGGSLELIEKNPDLTALCRDPRYAEMTRKKGR